MTRVEETVGRWRADGIPLGASASPSAVTQLAEFVGAPLPLDVQELYRAADGMADDTDGLVSFWPIVRILSEPEVREGIDQKGPYRDIAFADVMISSWFFFLRVRGRQVTVFSENTAEELPSLSELLARYLHDPDLAI